MKNSNYRKNTDNTGRKNQSSVIALGGICLALTLAFLFAGSVAPGIELTLFALSSLFTAVMVLESGVGAAALLYAAAVILGFFIVPNKPAVIPYAFFFGYYGILKFYPLQGTSRLQKAAARKHTSSGLSFMDPHHRRHPDDACLRLYLHALHQFLSETHTPQRHGQHETELEPAKTPLHHHRRDLSSRRFRVPRHFRALR